MLSLSRFIATGVVLLSLSACADDAPAAPDLEVVTVQPVQSPDAAAAATDTALTTEADAPVPVAPPAAPAPDVPSAPAAAAPAPPTSASRQAPVAERPRVQTFAVTVTAAAFEPARIALDPGVPARIVFTRTSDKTCATQVVFPSLGIGPVDLPLGEPVTVDVPANGPGEIAFACGMDMMRGALVIGS